METVPPRKKAYPGRYSVSRSEYEKPPLLVFVTQPLVSNTTQVDKSSVRKSARLQAKANATEAIVNF